MNLNQRIESYKKQARTIQKELWGKDVKVTDEYKFDEPGACDHCSRYIVNQRAVLINDKKEWWGTTCASKAHMIELFLND